MAENKIEEMFEKLLQENVRLKEENEELKMFLGQHEQYGLQFLKQINPNIIN